MNLLPSILDTLGEPRTPDELYHQAFGMTCILQSKYQQEDESARQEGVDPPPLKLFTRVEKTVYGARVVVAWRSPIWDYCHCDEDDCIHLHAHSMKKSVHKVSSDNTLRLFYKCIENELLFFSSIYLDSEMRNQTQR